MCVLCVRPDIFPGAHFLGTASAAPPGDLPSLSGSLAAQRIAAAGWGGALEPGVTYGFKSSGSGTDFERLKSAQMSAVESALELWSDVANIRFVRVGTGSAGEAAYSNTAVMSFSGVDGTATKNAAWAYLPGSKSANSVDGDVVLNTGSGLFDDLRPGTFSFMAVLHEIGHAIGLRHPGDYNGSATGQAYAEDNHLYSVMSYFDAWTGGAWHRDERPSTPMMHDIAALQLLYGANLTTRTGDTVYGFNSNTGREVFELKDAGDIRVFCVWDAGGRDTLDFSGYGDDQIIDLEQESFSSVGGLEFNVSIAKGAVIENARGGSGNDILLGNSEDNELSGGLGDDRLYGGLGGDVLRYDGGYDVFDGGDGEDTSDFRLLERGIWCDLASGIITLAEEGISADAARDGIGRLLATLRDVENVRDTAFADRLDGDAQDNVFFLSGGSDAVDGRDGHDMADFSAYELAIEADLALGRAVAAGVAGWAVSLARVEGVAGTRFADILRGDEGSNTLDGGAGDDVLTGGAGDDIYIVDSEGDVIVEAEDGGFDTVYTTLSAFDLDGSNIEDAVLLAAAERAEGGALRGNGLDNGLLGGRGDDHLEGLSGNDVLIGLRGHDLLDGGLGGDIMYGGEGNDTYVVESASDVVVELAGTREAKVGGKAIASGGTGFDTILATVTTSLPQNVERLILLGGEAINAWGNAVANTLTGNMNPAQNLLFGLAGNDRYFVGSGDRAIEAARGGTDTVISAVSRTLEPHIERLTLVGSANASLTGNAANNMIHGNAGDNWIDGRSGHDFLTGGAGHDRFVFSTALSPRINVDRIADFRHGSDRIVLDREIFPELRQGHKLDACQFVVGRQARDAEDRILYDRNTGSLFYDADGSGHAAAIKFAVLDTHPKVGAGDFMIV